jgi:hypothetical protein
METFFVTKVSILFFRPFTDNFGRPARPILAYLSFINTINGRAKATNT